MDIWIQAGGIECFSSELEISDWGSDSFELSSGLPVLSAVALKNLSDIVAEVVLKLVLGGAHASHLTFFCKAQRNVFDWPPVGASDVVNSQFSICMQDGDGFLVSDEGGIDVFDGDL